MTAVISPSTSTMTGLDADSKPEVIDKIDDHVARVNDAVLLTKDDGIWTCSDDRSVRLYLKRENGQYWPSIHHLMPVAATVIHFSEESRKLLVGLLNGHVYDYKVADDYNSITELRHWSIHGGPISGLYLALASERVFSCSKDKTIVWHCSETAVRQGGYGIDSSCICMAVELPFIFVGDHAGSVHVLRLNGNDASLVSKLSAHTGPITSLAWDTSRERLFSSSVDNLVIMWDIGGKKGQAYELNGHCNKVTKLTYACQSQRLFSADDTGKLMCWDMSQNRLETPAWANSDNCQLCDSPFFWNLAAMWQRKVVGLRQHHCRTCGKAVCASCCQTRTTYPKMGFELEVRICKMCNEKIEANPQDHESQSNPSVGGRLRRVQSAIYVPQEVTGKMLTVGQNRAIMVWDVKPLL